MHCQVFALIGRRQLRAGNSQQGEGKCHGLGRPSAKTQNCLAGSCFCFEAAARSAYSYARNTSVTYGT